MLYMPKIMHGRVKLWREILEASDICRENEVNLGIETFLGSTLLNLDQFGEAPRRGK